MEGNFNASDKEKLIEFLNMLGTKAKLNDLSIGESIKFYGLLSYIQKELLPKIESNILEVIQVTEEESKEE